MLEINKIPARTIIERLRCACSPSRDSVRENRSLRNQVGHTFEYTYECDFCGARQMSVTQYPKISHVPIDVDV